MAPPTSKGTKNEKSKATARRLHASFPVGSEGDVDVELDEAITTLKTWGVDQRAIDHALRNRDSAWLADLVGHCEATDDENALRGGTLDLAKYAGKRCWHPELYDPDEPAAPSRNGKSLRGLTDEEREREQERRELNEMMPGYGDMVLKRN